MGTIVVAASSCLWLEIANSVNLNPRPSRLLHANNLPLPFCSPDSFTEYPPALDTNNKYRKDILFRDHVALRYPERQFLLFLQDSRDYNGLLSNLYIPLNAMEGHRRILLDWRNTLPSDLKRGDKDPVPSSVFQALGEKDGNLGWGCEALLWLIKHSDRIVEASMA
jgi:hypothetical protein